MGRATDIFENFYAEHAAEKSPQSAAQWDHAVRSSGRLDIVVACCAWRHQKSLRSSYLWRVRSTRMTGTAFRRREELREAKRRGGALPLASQAAR